MNPSGISQVTARSAGTAPESMYFNEPINILIVDDEPKNLTVLETILDDPGYRLVRAASADEALLALVVEEFALLILDIRMPGMTGVEAARAIAQLPTDDEDAADGWHGCEIVFITAYDQYAIEAFEQGVVDYVLKPAERERLAVTVERIKKRLARNAGGPGAHGDDPPPAMQQLLQKLVTHMDPSRAPTLRWIQATVGQSIQMIPVEDVLFFISDEKYTRVQTATLEALIRKPIKELIDELDAEVFWQIHRSTLVNTRHIAGVSRDLRGRQLVSVKGHPEKLEVSRSFTGLFKGM